MTINDLVGAAIEMLSADADQRLIITATQDVGLIRACDTRLELADYAA